MAKKSELEVAHQNCLSQCNHASFAVANAEFTKAIGLAEGCLPDQHGSITYQRRFLVGNRVYYPAIDILLLYAPAFFAVQALETLQHWFTQGSKAERAAVPEIPSRIEEAKSDLATASRVWSQLSTNPDSTLSLREHSAPVAKIVKIWTAAGLVEVNNIDNRVRRSSDTRRLARGKCSGCGRQFTATLHQLIDPIPCPGCGQRRPIVITERLSESRP